MRGKVGGGKKLGVCDWHACCEGQGGSAAKEPRNAMESTNFLALSKQVALEMRLSNIANNLANASTPGYRRNEMSFEGYLSRQHASAPILYPVERGVRVDLGEGPAIATGNQLDLSITGNDRAFFVVAR
ncbi:MAG: flagellar hook basal-body protein, partial [Alphaproteobacteria bacterium]|nr:flagellar hook basal-body protein [Alphaproteobacteria bacterium]